VTIVFTSAEINKRPAIAAKTTQLASGGPPARVDKIWVLLRPSTGGDTLALRATSGEGLRLHQQSHLCALRNHRREPADWGGVQDVFEQAGRLSSVRARQVLRVLLPQRFRVLDHRPPCR
jgi:hypothetical protein